MTGYNYGYTPPPPPRRNGVQIACLGCLLSLVIGCCLLGGVLAVAWPSIRTAFSEQLGAMAVSALDDATTAQGLTSDPISDLVTAVPPGEYVIDNAQLRTALTSAGLPAADNVAFIDDRLVLPLEALGFPGTFSTEIGAAEGRLIFIDPRIEGPLGAAVDPAALIEPLLLRLNEAIITRERTIEQATIDGDRLVLILR